MVAGIGRNRIGPGFVFVGAGTRLGGHWGSSDISCTGKGRWRQFSVERAWNRHRELYGGNSSGNGGDPSRDGVLNSRMAVGGISILLAACCVLFVVPKLKPMDVVEKTVKSKAAAAGRLKTLPGRYSGHVKGHQGWID